MAAPIRIHPQNHKIFEFRNQPRVLICATEHYGAVMNRPFQFKKYLADCAGKSQNYTRLFTLFRELQTDRNPYSTCKPESPDYIAPFKRIGPGRALDGQPAYDLNQWNPEFFGRLHRFLSLAGECGVVVEVTLLSNTYAPNIWELNPLNAKNNINGTEELNHFTEYTTLRHPKMLQYQGAHVRKIIEETNKYDNIIYEICNEPGGGTPALPEYAPVEEVNRWLCAIADVIRQTEATLPNKHLISGQEAFAYTPPDMHAMQNADYSFDGFPVDSVNMHPQSDMRLRGKRYDIGEFMGKQTTLKALHDYCLAAYQNETKPLNLDEDNAASQFKDYDGWTIHRKRAWTTVMCGGHYDYIDFSIINYCETGTKESRKYIRSWMKYLTDYVHSIDLVHATVLPDLVKEAPEHVLPVAFGLPGSDYTVYLADSRELTDSEAGSRIKGGVALNLPAGRYKLAFFDPQKGTYGPETIIDYVKGSHIKVPAFRHDIVVRLIGE